jgi:hypothetical protein
LDILFPYCSVPLDDEAFSLKKNIGDKVYNKATGPLHVAK